MRPTWHFVSRNIWSDVEYEILNQHLEHCVLGAIRLGTMEISNKNRNLGACKQPGNVSKRKYLADENQMFRKC